MNVHIGRLAWDAVRAHCCEPPVDVEKCGIIAGAPGGPAMRPVRMANALATEAGRYAFDPAEQLAVWADLDDRGEDPIVVYHSHPFGPAYPSPGDIALALDPAPVHLIVAVRAGGIAETAAFRIVDRTVQPVEVTVV